MNGNTNVGCKGNKFWFNIVVGFGPSKNSCIEIPVSCEYKEGLNLSLLDSIMEKIMLAMENALVGKFISFCPNIDLVWKWAKEVWKLKGGLTTSAMKIGLFLFRVSSLEDMHKVVFEGPWSFGCKNRNNISWCKCKGWFDPSVNLCANSLTWFFLLGSPLKFWDLTIISSILNSFN